MSILNIALIYGLFIYAEYFAVQYFSKLIKIKKTEHRQVKEFIRSDLRKTDDSH